MLVPAMLLAQAMTACPSPFDPTRYLLINSYAAWRAGTFKAVAPTFPAELRAAVQVTTVVVDVVVNRHGLIRRASVGKGHDKAQVAALRAAMQWLLEPPPQDVSEREVRLTFTFRTLPATASPEELVTVFPSKYEVDVRALVAAQPSEP